MEPNGGIDDKVDTKVEAPQAPRPASPTPQQKARDTKALKILDACKWKDIEALRLFATLEDGLVSDSVRREAWPLLLGCASAKDQVKQEARDSSNWRDLPPHKDEDQVRLDVNRSFIYYPHNQSSKDADRRKGELSDLILEVLRKQPYLHYFQGYHDICQVFLLVLEPEQRAIAVARLSALRIRDYMLPTLAPSLAQLRLIPSIIYTVNPKLYKHLPLTQPFFAIPGILTMYAHDIQEYGDIARIFDVLLAREAVFSVYMFAQIVLQRADELFEIDSDEPEMLHSVLSKLPKPLKLETLIANTIILFEKYPPETLRTWSSISSSSVLKTARLRNQTASQTLEDGKIYFDKQVKELQRQEQLEKTLKLLWQYRRPAKAIGVAVAIGLVSYWLRSASGSSILKAFWRAWYDYREH